VTNQDLQWISTSEASLNQGLTIWRQILNSFKSQFILNGNLITNQALKIGANVIYHNLGQPQRGWIITDIDGAAEIYRSQPFNSKTLTLTSNAAVTVSLWCF